MITKNENGFGWGSLLLAVLFFIAGWTALNNPLTTLIALGLMYGITAIVQRVSVLMYYFELKKVLPGNPWYLILIGVLDLLVGLYLVFNPAVSVTFLPMLFVFWFLIDSIMNIFLAFRLKDSQRSWFWVRLTLGILGVVIGFALAGNLLAAIISVTYLIAFYFFTGAIITESVFSMHGLGFLAVRSVTDMDLPTIVAMVMIVSAFVVIANMIVDVLYGFIDPRVKVA